MSSKRAITAIENRGILLVFPIQNRKEPPSLWSELHPRTEMVWKWDEDGDDRVGDLWHLRAKLSLSRKVIYAKWFQGRATFFSRDAFVSCLSILNPQKTVGRGLSPTSSQILELLNADSPLSVRTLKDETELKGRALESLYQRAMNELWSRLLIVGFGEIEDGAFPSLAIGSTKLIFEELWEEAEVRNPEEAWTSLKNQLGEKSKLLEAIRKILIRNVERERLLDRLSSD